MKKIIAAVLAMIMVVGCLSACGGSKPAATTAAPAGGNDATTAAPAGGNDATAAAPADDTVYKLKIDYPNPENSAIYPVLVKWADWMREQSNGRIDAKIYSGGALGSIKDCVANVEAGVTDGCWSATNLYSGLWPLQELEMLPMLGVEDYKARNKALDEVYKSGKCDAEWSNVKMIAVHTHTKSTFVFKDKVTSFKDALQGTQVRTLSALTSPWLEELGAIPVSVSSNEGYESISKGVVGGGLWFLDQIQSSALYEVIKTAFYTETAYTSLFLCINKDVYESMPADLQKVVDDSHDYFMSLLDEVYDAQEEEVLKLCEDAGVEVLSVPDDERQWLIDTAAKTNQKFIDAVDGGQEFYDYYVGLCKKYADELGTK